MLGKGDTMKEKKQGVNLQIRSFTGSNGKQYLVFRTPTGAYNVFAEVEAKEAARDCGCTVTGNTRKMWESLWKQ